MCFGSIYLLKAGCRFTNMVQFAIVHDVLSEKKCHFTVSDS